jgi:hydroxymethylpyrimidine pyrophosphatase-like HAD family hydrolase
MMEKFLFLDLDDTIFHSERKCDSTQPLKPMAFRKDQSPVSYSNPKQLALIELFQREMRIIPTTARNLDAFSRVAINFSESAILDHGAVIVDAQGQPDGIWHGIVSQQLQGVYAELLHIQDTLLAYAQTTEPQLNIRMIGDFDLNIYVLIKHIDHNNSALIQVLKQCIEPLLKTLNNGFYIHINDNNLAILPNCIGKHHAVDFMLKRLKKQYGDPITWGMGDSHSDADFMALCDYAMIPGGSQLHEQFIDRTRQST